MPTLESPAPLRKPDHPAVVALKAEADAVRQEAEQAAARADSMTVAAKITGQKISALERERTALQQRLANIAARNLQAQLESAKRDVSRLYAAENLDAVQNQTLNEATLALLWIPELRKLVPGIQKDLEARLEKIETELASLTSK
jgi:predicted  nucleic acid-binding Zn-ribbon protein